MSPLTRIGIETAALILGTIIVLVALATPLGAFVH
jgi:hypothetical protein